MNFSIVNESTMVTAADSHVLAECLQHSLAVFCDQWGLVHPRVEAVQGAAAGTQEQAEGECLIVLFDDADQQGALGYHTLTPDGKPYAEVFVRDSVADLSGATSVQGVLPRDLLLATLMSVIDHEGKEAALDPDAADMVDDGTGTLWAKEACDAVESDNDPTPITLHDGTTVTATLSNHLLPDYFRPGSPGPWDHSGKLTGPFTYDKGGYVIVEKGGQIQQLFGDEIADWRKADHIAAFTGVRATASRTGWRAMNAAAKAGVAPT